MCEAGENIKPGDRELLPRGAVPPHLWVERATLAGRGSLRPKPTPAPVSFLSAGPSGRPCDPSWTPSRSSRPEGAPWADPMARANRTAWARPASQGFSFLNKTNPTRFLFYNFTSELTTRGRLFKFPREGDHQAACRTMLLRNGTKRHPF